MSRLLRAFLSIPFYLNCIALLLSISAAYVNPFYIWPVAVFGLFFKLFILVHLPFIFLYFFMKWRRQLLLAVIIFLFALPSVTKIFAFSFRNKSTDKQTFSVMTYNIASMSFGIQGDDPLSIINNITSVNPDIVCLQEYFSYNQELKYRLMSIGKYKWFRYRMAAHDFADVGSGQCIFSRFPIISFHPVFMPHEGGNGAFYADLKVGKDTVRIINVHLESISLNKDEYAIDKNSGVRHEIKSKKGTLKKLRNAYRLRALQVAIIEKIIKESPYKTILCGDFNDTPISYAYARLTKKLDDSFLKTNFGLGSTFNGKIPFLRIDYILAGKGITPLSTEIIHKGGSDHFPLVARLAI